MSIPEKTMVTVMLNRMRSAVDRRLRQEQSGFRSERSCMQIFTLGQITEKSSMWETLVLINFIDFKKAFDSVHVEIHYGE